MERVTSCAAALIVGLCLQLGAGSAAAFPSGDAVKGLPDDPVFLQWLVPGDPDDETIRVYWERASQGELSADELVDLGTMLYHRGYPMDAIRVYRNALDMDKKMYEAWYRIGVVEHREHNFEDARYAYRKCLKILEGHGWCNFYLGLVEEQTGHPSKALDYYKRAYQAAPELSDPRINPDVLYSKLQIGATIQQRDRERFSETVPMPFLVPSEVRAVRSRYLPSPTPTPIPTVTPLTSDRETTRQPTTGGVVGGVVGGGAATGGTSGSTTSPRVRSRPPGSSSRQTPEIPGDTPYGVRRPDDSGGGGGGGAGVYGSGVGSVSPEASLKPWWKKMPEWILVFV